MDANRVEKFIENNGKMENIYRAITTMLNEQDKAEWDKARQAEYELIYPTTRDMTWQEYIDKLDALSEVNYADSDDYAHSPDKPQIAVKYIITNEDGTETRIPTDYVTFDEWLQETKIITPAVEEEKDADGNITQEYIPEVTELVRPYVDKADWTAEIADYLANSTAYKAKLKRDKETALAKLTIESNTILYDANGKALGNMNSVVGLANWTFNQAIASGTALDDAYKTVYKDTTIEWRGADNEVHIVQVESICEALKSSMMEIAVVLGIKG